MDRGHEATRQRSNEASLSPFLAPFMDPFMVSFLDVFGPLGAHFGDPFGVLLGCLFRHLGDSLWALGPPGLHFEPFWADFPEGSWG